MIKKQIFIKKENLLKTFLEIDTNIFSVKDLSYRARVSYSTLSKAMSCKMRKPVTLQTARKILDAFKNRYEFDYLFTIVEIQTDK